MKEIAGSSIPGLSVLLPSDFLNQSRAHMSPPLSFPPFSPSFPCALSGFFLIFPLRLKNTLSSPSARGASGELLHVAGRWRGLICVSWSQSVSSCRISCRPSHNLRAGWCQPSHHCVGDRAQFWLDVAARESSGLLVWRRDGWGVEWYAFIAPTCCVVTSLRF